MRLQLQRQNLRSPIIVAAMVVAMSWGLYHTTLMQPIEVNANTCPAGMSLEACLRYLQDLAKDLEKDKGQITKKISDEAYSQLTLYEQLRYFNGLIADSQSKMDKLELQIEKNNIEINILAKEIAVLENNINTTDQEIDSIEAMINKRISFSYKSTFYSPIELFMNADELDNLIKRVQYIKKTKIRDQELLQQMAQQISDLNDEKVLLDEKREGVKEKQIELEKNKSDVFAVKSELDGLRGKQAKLLAESEAREAEFKANLSVINKAESQVSAQITQIIFEMYQQGQIPVNTPVKKGDIIGFQGHTGLSAGSHLHFVYKKNNVYTYPFSSGLLSGGGLWAPVGGGSGNAPLDGGLLTQTAHGGQNAIDLQSQNDYGYNGQTYKGGMCCYGYCIPEGYYSMRGEGAPVRAVKDGKVSAVRTDACGGKYVIIDHGPGETSLYLHLR